MKYLGLYCGDKMRLEYLLNIYICVFGYKIYTYWNADEYLNRKSKRLTSILIAFTFLIVFAQQKYYFLYYFHICSTWSKYEQNLCVVHKTQSGHLSIHLLYIAASQRFNAVWQKHKCETIGGTYCSHIGIRLSIFNMYIILYIRIMVISAYALMANILLTQALNCYGRYSFD